MRVTQQTNRRFQRTLPDCLDEAIDCVSLAVQSDGHEFCALILTGSAARAEMTIVERDGSVVWLSDLEFLVPIESPKHLPSARESLARITKAVSAQLLQKGQQLEVELTPAPFAYFTSLTPRIFSVELKEHGRQLFGKTNVLDLVPEIPTGGISEEEAWRLLSNRLVERIAADLEWDALTVIEARYGLSKLALDILTSSAVFAGAYETSYERRYRRKNSVLNWLRQEGLEPNLVDRYSEIVSNTMKFKMHSQLEQNVPAVSPHYWGVIGDRGEGHDELNDLRKNLTRIALEVWAIQLSHVVGASGRPADVLDTLDLLRRLDSWRTKTRGWAVAAAKAPADQRMQVIGRAVRLMARGTPRSHTYGCAWALLQDGVGADETLAWVERHLPLVRPKAKGADRWRCLSTDCVDFWRSVLRMSVT